MRCGGCKFSFDETQLHIFEYDALCQVCFGTLWGKCWRKTRTSLSAAAVRRWQSYPCPVCGQRHRTSQMPDEYNLYIIQKKVRTILRNLGRCGETFEFIGNYEGRSLILPTRTGGTNVRAIDNSARDRQLVRDYSDCGIRDHATAARRRQ